MSLLLTFTFTALAILAFAGNSILCRLALGHTSVDPATFTAVRLSSGAVTLVIISRLRHGGYRHEGSWIAAMALVAYAAAFSYAYVSLSAATGALLLFTAVQVTMVGNDIRRGYRLVVRQTIGLVIALAGLLWLLGPGLSGPSVLGSVLMLGAGAAWGIYSLYGKSSGDPVLATTGYFLRALPLAALISLTMFRDASLDTKGLGYAVVSGAITSGIGYVIWYRALRGLRATSAAVVQLSVPVVAAMGGILFLDEVVTMRLFLSTISILAGVALVVTRTEGSRVKD